MCAVFLPSNSKLQNNNVDCEEIPTERDTKMRKKCGNYQNWLQLHPNL